MSGTPDSTAVADWHRYFAIEANNRAWGLAAGERTSDQDREMLDCAHAAAYHWNAIGTELNRMRALTLLGQAHALLGHGETAVGYAQTVLDYFDGRDDTPDWERALVYAIVALAASAASQTKLHAEMFERARASVEAIADPEDRQIVLETFDQVPVP